MSVSVTMNLFPLVRPLTHDRARMSANLAMLAEGPAAIALPPLGPFRTEANPAFARAQVELTHRVIVILPLV